MALEEKYVRVFRKECVELSFSILECLTKISKNPHDSETIEKMVQSADTIIGDSRFVGDVRLEKAAKRLLSTFDGISDANLILDEVQHLKAVFKALLSRP